MDPQPQPNDQPANPTPLAPREYPQATPTPPTPQATPTTQPFQQPNFAVAEKKTDGLGIASIITSLIGLGLVGFVLGLIGASKAKKAGQKPTLSVIGWILGLISTLIGGTIIALLVFAFLNVGSTNKKYLNAVFAKDYDTACALSGEDSTEADRTACEKFLDNFNKDYSSYDNTGVESINGVTTLNVKYNKKDGGSSTGYISVVNGLVTKFIYGIGDTPSTDEETSDDAEVSVAPTASTDTCLTDADIQGVYTERTDLLQESYGTTDKIFWAESFFFTADSTDYAYPTVMPKYLNMLADVYKNNPDKSFMFELKGSVKEQNATTGGDELAHDRVEKIKSDLVALGVPASRFEEIPPVHTETDYNDDSERNVSVNIVVYQPCTAVGSGR